MSKFKIALFGAVGKTGNTLLTEALKRRAKVTAIVYDVNKVLTKHANLDVIWGHMTNPDEVYNYVKDHDVVIAVHEPIPANPAEHVKAVQSVIEGTKRAGINHLVVIGHPIHKPIENTIEFYDSWKPVIKAQKDALKLFQREGCLHWYYIRSAELQPDPNTGRLNQPGNMLFTTYRKEYTIPINNYSTFLFDIVEKKSLFYKAEFELQPETFSVV
jgi:putative NADH-flavin reductase